uniref:YbaK/EbsC family protein n=1 Tax=Eiseniibacteriota bacterium TaxID=2212470 RepID=A0A832I4A2_UNCEI
MALNERLVRLLDEQGASFAIVPHRVAFTAQEVAHASHVSGWKVAKVVVVREGLRNYLMAVVPASAHLDFGILRRMTGRKELGLANEEELRMLFPDCDPGAMPPFGNLYGMPVYLDACFRDARDIYFQAGNHAELVRMRFADYEALAGPFAGEFCLHEEHALAHA